MSAMPSARAAPDDRSMQRPLMNGPRSLIRTVTLRPLLWEVTVTCDPNDRVRWAAVMALGSYVHPMQFGRRYIRNGMPGIFRQTLMLM